MAGYDPVDSFTQFGVPRDAAKGMLRFLQRTVAPRVCELLPGVEHSVAPSTMVIAQAVLLRIVPDLTGQILGVQDAFAARGVAGSSVLPLVLLEGVNSELIVRSRKRSGRAGTPGTKWPHPSPNLVVAALGHSWRHPEIPAPMATALSETLKDAVWERVQDPGMWPYAPAWTGWALRAVMAALVEHEDALPLPGRGDPSSMPGKAFLAGRALVIAAGQGLT